VERTTYQPFGATESDYRPARWDAFREDYRFTGKEEDAEVGLTYFGERFYAPLLGRWMSADPLAVHGLGADLNLYAYVHGAVFKATDPLGLDGSSAAPCPEWGPDAVSVTQTPRGTLIQGVTVTPLGEGRVTPPDAPPGPSGPPAPPSGNGADGAPASNSGASSAGAEGPSLPFDYNPLLMAAGATSKGGGPNPLDSAGGTEHTGNARPSTKGRHQEGQGRKKQDRGGEKGDDSRRLPSRRPMKWKGPWPGPKTSKRTTSEPVAPSTDWGPAAAVGAVIGGVVIIVGTLVEDVFTAGAGFADDPVTLGAGAAMIGQGLQYAR